MNPQPANDGSPWLDNRQWAAREIRTEPIIGGRALAVAFAAFGWIPAVLVVESLEPGQPLDEIVQMLAAAAMSVLLLDWLTYSWLQHRRYGDSVCRLLTLPGAIGGRLEVDVECRLSAGSVAPVVVRLTNRTLRGKAVQVHWQMERRIEPGALRACGDGRVIVPLRLDIPRYPAQRPCAAEAGRFATQWLLEIRRKAAGMDFRVEFDVPVFDIIASRPRAGLGSAANGTVGADRLERVR